MYNCSNAFHEAVKNGNEQKALLIFSDCVFTDEDISVEDGIELHDYFNTEEDLSIGQATSNEISFSLFNDDRLLNNYEFGDFLATLGVHVGTDAYQQYGQVMLTTQYATYIGNDSYPFITRNGMALVQPSFAVRSILAYDGKVWCFDGQGHFAVFFFTFNMDALRAFRKARRHDFQHLHFALSARHRVHGSPLFHKIGGGLLRGATANDNFCLGVTLDCFAYRLAAFPLRLSRYRAGVDDIEVGVFQLPRNLVTECFQATDNRAALHVIYLTTECIYNRLHRSSPN